MPPPHGDGLDYGTYRLPRNVAKELPLYAAQIPEERRSLLLRSRSLKSTDEIVADLRCAVKGERLILVVLSHQAVCDASQKQHLR